MSGEAKDEKSSVPERSVSNIDSQKEVLGSIKQNYFRLKDIQEQKNRTMMAHSLDSEHIPLKKSSLPLP